MKTIIKSPVKPPAKTPVKAPRKREFVKHVMVSPEVHRALKAFAILQGYKTQYIADRAIQLFIEREEAKP